MWPWRYSSSDLFFAAKACVVGGFGLAAVLVALGEIRDGLIGLVVLLLMAGLSLCQAIALKGHEEREEMKLREKQVIIRDFDPPSFARKDGGQDEKEPSDA